MRCFTCFILAVSLLIQMSYSASAQTVAEKIDMLIDQQLPHATVGILVKDMETNQIIYSRNANKLLSPASSMKLFTAAAALYQLTPDYRFGTTLSRKNQDIYITFSGAPDFTSEHLNTLISFLKKSGVNVIQGNLVLDNSRFKAPYYSGGVSYDDLGWYYSAPETAIIVNENSAAYEFISAKKLGKPMQIKAKTSEQFLHLVNQVITVSKEQEKNHCSLNIEIQPRNQLRLFGCMSQTSAPRTLKFAIPDPLMLAKQLINEQLKKNNITLKGQIITGHSPSDAQFLTDIQSNHLSQLITHMLKTSDNLYANSITRLLGFFVTGEGSNKQGAFAIKKILAQHTSLDMTQVKLADGIGTRYNLATPQQLVVLLSDLYSDQTMQPIFFNALPQAGLSGSLKERMKVNGLNKMVLAKTGTMHDISSLSGYLLKPKAKPLIFAIMINGINSPISKAKDLEEQILELISLNFGSGRTADAKT